jgi:hypothetical protein
MGQPAPRRRQITSSRMTDTRYAQTNDTRMIWTMEELYLKYEES